MTMVLFAIFVGMQIMSPVMPSWLSLSSIMRLYSRGVASVVKGDASSERSRKSSYANDGVGRDVEAASTKESEGESEAEGSETDGGSGSGNTARRKLQKSKSKEAAKGFLETVSVGATQLTTTLVGGAVNFLLWFLASTGRRVHLTIRNASAYRIPTLHKPNSPFYQIHP